MITISIDDNGLANKLSGANFGTTFSPPVRKSLLLIESKMKVYPSPPSGSRYRRTGTLGRRWTTTPVSVSGTTITGSVGNNTSYGPFVQSKSFQASIHTGRWQTDEDVVTESTGAIVGFFENAVGDFLG